MDKIEKARADLEAAVTAVDQGTTDPRMITDALVASVKSVIADLKADDVKAEPKARKSK